MWYTIFNHLAKEDRAVTEVIKLFSYSTQLSMKFQLHIKTKMLKNKDFSCLQTVQWCIFHANEC